MNHQLRPTFWEYTRKSAKDATRDFFEPLFKLSSLSSGGKSYVSSRETIPKADTSTGISATDLQDKPLGEERKVDSSGVRVYSHVEEPQVEAGFTLREEPVGVARRPNSRLVTAADFNPRRERLAMHTSREEHSAFIRSTRVIEEVLVGKEVRESKERTRYPSDKTEIDVEALARSLTIKGS